MVGEWAPQSFGSGSSGKSWSRSLGNERSLLLSKLDGSILTYRLKKSLYEWSYVSGNILLALFSISGED